ncbi:MAG: Replicative DNA helicase [Legionellaceae bacterium]
MAIFSNNPHQKTVDLSLAGYKILPHSIEAEQSVIGAILIDNTVWDRTIECVQEIDFYRPAHQLIFRVMTSLIKKSQPIDILTLTEELKKNNLLDQIGGEFYLFELSKNTPSITNITAYANIVRERSVLRQLIAVAQEIAQNSYESQGRSSIELLEEAERKVFAIAEQTARGGGPVEIKQLLTEAIDKIDALKNAKDTITGLPTGYFELDDMTSGLQDSDLIIIAGRPSMGKTTFAMNIAEHAAIKGTQPVLVFSMEMPGSSLAMRMISSLGRIDQNKIRTGKLAEEDWPRLVSAVTMLSEAKMFIDDTPALSPAELSARARRLAKEHGQLGLIVIDYLQLMQIPGLRENRTAEISEISRALKMLAKDLHVPVIALSQLNRSLEQRSDKRPVMSDLRESGAIEQDADLIVFIYRDEVYNPDSQEKGTAEIIIAKQRNGPIGKTRLTFLGKYTRFENFQPNNYG